MELKKVERIIDSIVEQQDNAPDDLEWGEKSERGDYSFSRLDPEFVSRVRKYLRDELYNCKLGWSTSRSNPIDYLSGMFADCDTVERGWWLDWGRNATFAFIPIIRLIDFAGAQEYMLPRHLRLLARLGYDIKDIEESDCIPKEVFNVVLIEAERMLCLHSDMVDYRDFCNAWTVAWSANYGGLHFLMVRGPLWQQQPTAESLVEQDGTPEDIEWGDPSVGGDFSGNPFSEEEVWEGLWNFALRLTLDARHLFGDQYELRDLEGLVPHEWLAEYGGDHPCQQEVLFNVNPYGWPGGSAAIWREIFGPGAVMPAEVVEDWDLFEELRQHVISALETNEQFLVQVKDWAVAWGVAEAEQGLLCLFTIAATEDDDE